MCSLAEFVIQAFATLIGAGAAFGLEALRRQPPLEHLKGRWTKSEVLLEEC